MALVGLGGDDRLTTSAGRVAERDLVDAAVASFCRARTSAEVIDAFVAADAAIAPVLAMTEVLTDPHVVERGILDEHHGVRMPGPIARLSATPGSMRWLGRPPGADTADVLSELDP